MRSIYNLTNEKLDKTYGGQRQVSLYLYMPIIGRHIYLGTVYEIPYTQPVEEVVDYWLREMEIFGTRPLHTFDKLHKMFVIFAIKNNLSSPDIDTIYAPFHRMEKILKPKDTDADQWY